MESLSKLFNYPMCACGHDKGVHSHIDGHCCIKTCTCRKFAEVR